MPSGVSRKSRLPVAAVANGLLDLARDAGQQLTPLQLQKMLYFAQGWHLALRGEPLLNERVEAWRYGPVIPSVYRHFKDFGNRGIDRRAMDYDASRRQWGVPKIPEDEWLKQFLGRIWKVYSRYSPGQLVTLTHAKGGPWEITVRKMGSDLIRGTNIAEDLMRDYFTQRLRKYDEAI